MINSHPSQVETSLFFIGGFTRDVPEFVEGFLESGSLHRGVASEIVAGKSVLSKEPSRRQVFMDKMTFKVLEVNPIDQ